MKVGGEKRESFEEDRLPPQLSVKVIELSDVPYESWSDANQPIDILLIVENDFELSSCLSFLDQPFKSDNKEVGHVYFGRIGNASNEEKLKVALAKCSKAAASPEGSLTMAMTAVEILQPKAVFFVGTCNGLSSKKVSLGDVVIPSSLTAAVGSKVFASPRLGDLAKDVTNQWVAPLQNTDALEVKVHHGGNILKQSLTVDCTYDDLHELYPEAIAVEAESEGISFEAYNDSIKWVIVKGVTSYFNQTKSSTSGWMSFASTMAASIVASMLKHPVVFQKWSHYSQAFRTFSEARLRKMEERVLMSFKGSPSEMEELQRKISEARSEVFEEYRMFSEARLRKMEEYRMRSEARLRDIEERVLMSFKGSPSEMEALRMIYKDRWEATKEYKMFSEASLKKIEEYSMRSEARLRDMEERVLMSFKGSPSEMEEFQGLISEARSEVMEDYRIFSKASVRKMEERVLMSFKGSPSEMEELQRMISEARSEVMEDYRMFSEASLRKMEERVLMSFKGNPSEKEEMQRLISEARSEVMEDYGMFSEACLRKMEERVLMSFKGSPSEMEELQRKISEARSEVLEGVNL